MENAGKDDIPDEAERKGLGTPATRAAIIEKLVAAGFVERKGKSLIPTKAGINLVTVLPEPLTSPILTAEWEQKLTEIAKGNADPDTFMGGIRTMVQEIVSTYSCISEDGKKLFAPEKEGIGTCPRCGQPVYEGKKNFACSDRSCGFVLWKNDRFWTSRKKELTKKMAADLLKKGRTNVKGMWSEKKQAAYDAAVILDDTGGKYINFKLELTDTQAQALLESSSPLADVYRYFEKLETGHMDVIRDSIENRADDVCRAKEELRTTPIYPHSAAYAREHGELEQYRASNNVNRQCKESIEAAVREHFDGMYLSHDAAKGVIETYGMERVSMVLSNTIQLQDWDGRYSRRNKEWAKTIPNDNPETVRCGYALNSHPAVLDGFIDLVREEQQRSRTQREKLEPSRPSVRDKLKQELPANKSAAPKKRELER